MKSWFFSTRRSAINGTFEGTVLGFSPCILSKEKQLNIPLLAAEVIAGVDIGASMGLMLDEDTAFDGTAFEGTAFEDVQMELLDFVDLLEDRKEPGGQLVDSFGVR